MFNYHTTFCPGISSIVVKKNIKCNIFQIEVYFSYFKFDIYINFCEGRSKSPVYLSEIGSGGLGRIYDFANKHAIKNIEFTNETKA